MLVEGDQQIAKSDSWVSHTHDVIIQSEELNAFVSSMLAAQRGYLITKDTAFLADYEAKKASVSRNLARLSELTIDNPSQQSRLEELRQYSNNLAMQLEERSKRNQDPKDILSDVKIIDGLKADIIRLNKDFLEEEYILLNQRIKAVENKKDQYLSTLFIGGGVAVIFLMMLNGYLLRVQSKRSAAELAFGEKEEIFRLAIEGTQDGVFDWNIKTDDVFYSDQFKAMLGYKAEDFKGHVDDFISRLHPEDKKRVQEYVELYIGGQLSEYSNTFRMQHKSGRWIWINSRAQLLYDKSGEPLRIVGAHTDITAFKDYESRLQDAKNKAEEGSRAKSDFLAHMSHEIRTPLTTISGAAEILSQDTDGLDEKKQTLISVLNASAITLKDLISDILDFSKIESGELELEENVFSLKDAFEHVISMMSVRMKEKGLDFTLDYSAVKNIDLYGDPIRMRQILINLIGNALKFTEAGHINVKAYESEYFDAPILRIDVEDTGIGLLEDQFELVFERFKQADASVSRKYGGTGLGLPISKKLANLMGGDILLTSEPGKGSVFSLIIPLRIVENTALEQDTDDVRKHKINDKLKAAISNTDKILLVEDYEGNIVVLGYILDDLGSSYDIAGTGQEAVNLWKENHYDLVLMDIQMPEMDGFTATAHIRKIERENHLDHTPIIGMTAHALVGDKDKCIEAGMDAYLPKPIVEMDLKATILKFLEQKKKAA